MSKAVDAFRTISEVAAELAVPKHVLRFWEAKFPQIRPMKRGGGRRYYRPGDMELLRGIRQLLHAEGYTIKGVQKILREQGVDAVKFYSGSGAAPSAAETRSRRATRERGREGQGGTTSGSSSTDVPDGLSGRELIERMIAELEACRRLLVVDTATEDAARATRRPRAARS